MHSLPLPIAAFVAGLLSFVSPCVLPLVPGYVSLISGATVEDLRLSDRITRRRVFLYSVNFVVGFSIVFIILGTLASGLASTALGDYVAANHRILSEVAGIIVVILGLHLTGLWQINALFADKRFHNLKTSIGALGSFLAGMAFAFGWTPCIGPILATILILAAGQGGMLKGAVLLAIYSLGLAVPFLLTSLALGRFLTFYGRFRRHLHTVEVISGVLLIAVGVLIFLNNLKYLSGYLSFLNRFAL